MFSLIKKNLGRRSIKRYLGGRRLSSGSYLVEPFQQIRFGLHVIAVCFFYLILLVAALVWAFQAQYAQVMEWYNVAASEVADLVMNDVSMKAGLLVGGVLLAFVVTILYVVVRRTQRMYGPMVSIHRFIQDLSEGNYRARVRIREADDFQDLAQRLNALADKLESRHGTTASKTDTQSA